MIRAKVVRLDDDGQFVVTTFERTLVDFVAAIEALGFPQAGVERGPMRREELIGAPKFAGLAGPMWEGGGVLRYETWEVHNRLSA